MAIQISRFSWKISCSGITGPEFLHSTELRQRSNLAPTYRTWALKFTPCFSSTQPAPLTYTHHPFDILKYLNFQPFVYTGKTSMTLISQLLTKRSCFLGFPGGSVVKNLPGNAGDVGSIPRLGRSPGEENGNPRQYSCLEDPMDGGACAASP